MFSPDHHQCMGINSVSFIGINTYVLHLNTRCLEESKEEKKERNST